MGRDDAHSRASRMSTGELLVALGGATVAQVNPDLSGGYRWVAEARGLPGVVHHGKGHTPADALRVVLVSAQRHAGQ